MLVPKKDADEFIFLYKKLLTGVNDGKAPENIEDYARIRETFYQEREKYINLLEGEFRPDFIKSLKAAVKGKFAYLKKYKFGYVFTNLESNLYYQVKGLNSPIEDIASEYSIVSTTLLPFKNHYICDGLIVSNGVSIGKNIATSLRSGYHKAKKSGSLVKSA